MNLIERAKMKKLSKITKQKLSELDSDAFANLFEESESMSIDEQMYCYFNEVVGKVKGEE